MATIKRVTILNGSIVIEETMTIVGEIVLCSLHINGRLVDYEIFTVGQLREGY